MNDIHPVALFRYSVLGPLISRADLPRGQLKATVQQLAERHYDIPDSRNTLLSAKTIESWFYQWRRGGIEALVPKARSDRGRSKIAPEVQEAILAAKRENPRRSIRGIRHLLEQRGTAAKEELSRSAIHRLLRAHGLSSMSGSASEPEVFRAFVAESAGDIWYGDVMHGPAVPMNGRMRKAYLVSLMDDASRLITLSAFRPAETALDIEAVLKQAVLKRGLPKKLVLDNGPAYRAKTLQGICARLGIHLVYCRAYAPQGKGKLERWHRTLRQQFLSELDTSRLRDLGDLNARLWAWLESVYHQTPHGGLDHDQTPLQRYQRDLPRMRTLGTLAERIDEVFHHRVKRKVRTDGTVSYQGSLFEVPYELAGRWVRLVVDPHVQQVLSVEDDDGQPLGAATALDAVANVRRRRRKPRPPAASSNAHSGEHNAVELAYRHYHGQEGS